MTKDIQIKINGDNKEALEVKILKNEITEGFGLRKTIFERAKAVSFGF